MIEPTAVRLWKDGARDIATIALEAGVTERTVYRQLTAAGLREKHVYEPPADEAIVIARVAEGMPVTWAIEGTDVCYNRGIDITRDLPGRDEARKEWQRVWQRIAATEDLFARHEEFAPPSAHHLRVETHSLAA